MELISVINSLINSKIPEDDCIKVLEGLGIEGLEDQLNKIIADNAKVLFTSLSEEQRARSRIILSKVVLFKN